MKSNQKLKLLYLKKILQERTDENHGLTVSEIIEALASYGIQAERKALYDDIEALRQFGMDITVEKGKRFTYHLTSRYFELPELKLLVDVVQSSKFITHKKSIALIQKIAGLASGFEAAQLRRQVFTTNRVKAENETIYYNVDKIHEAIAADREITFYYFEWAPDKSKKYRNGGQKYTASPYALTWDDENYYLIAYSPKHSSRVHYRVDKMLQIELLESRRYVDDERFDPAEYSRKIFGMFGGEETQVNIRFENSLAGVVIDRFGHDIMLVPDGTSHFTVTLQVAVSPLFLSWVAGFGTQAKILYPESVAGLLRSLCQEILQNYR